MPTFSGRTFARGLMCVAALAGAAVPPLRAQPIPTAFPTPPGTAAAAAAGFSARAAAAIATNACGREDHYLRIRGEMAAGNFDSQGEDLTQILIGKVGSIRGQNPAVVNPPCTSTIIRARPRNADGSFIHATMTDFANADRPERARDAADPNACARETHEAHRFHEPNTLKPEQKTQLATDDQWDELAIEIAVAPDCMLRQLNDAILAMRKTTSMGSSDLQCLDHPSKTHGEFDVNVRELIRLLYLAGPRGRDPGLLAPSTVQHMYQSLLAARGGLADGSYSVILGCGEPAGDELGSPEDTADRHAWYKELADGIGDFLEWLFKAFVSGVAVALAFTPEGLIAMPFLLAAGFDPTELLVQHDVRVPETENHRLMIETSKYLTNADIIARLDAKGYDRVDDVRDDQREVRGWLLGRLQDIAINDFQEYNARPYTRYSLNAVLNLHDFAAVHGDAQLATAARIVLDLSEAKFAATSNRGRRAAPFRRRSVYDGYEPGHLGSADLYNVIEGADHEGARAMLLAGQTQLLAGGPPREAMAQTVNAATSAYRLPLPVLATAVERGVAQQTMRHTGVERVLQSPAFTIAAGGVPTGPTASLLGFSSDIDRGVAMPTTITPTIAGWRIGDLFRFDGTGGQSRRGANTCVAEGFACGVQPRLSDAFAGCTKIATILSSDNAFVSSALCFPGPGPHFYLAARLTDCTGAVCGPGQRWGLMDIVEATPPPAVNGQPASDPAFGRFQVERDAALNAADVDAFGDGVYVTAAGRRIEFNAAEASLLAPGPHVRSIDGAPPPPWRTVGDLIDADGAGRAVIKGPGGPITIDFSDRGNPQRAP